MWQSIGAGARAQWLVRWSAAILALGASLLVLSIGASSSAVWWFEVHLQSQWFGLPLPTRVLLVGLISTGAMAAILLTWARSEEEIQIVLADSRARNLWWTGWLLINVLAVTSLAKITSADWLGHPAGVPYLAAVAALALLALISWCLTAMPSGFWLRWARRNRTAFPAIAVVGLCAYLLVGHAPLVLAPLQRATVWASAHLLRLVVQNVVSEQEQALLGTTAFAVFIDPACAGWEGVTFLALFYGLYLWVFRKNLRFPHALILLPLGALILWALNIVRIVTLILLGGWSESLAMYGFHAIGGWLFFDLVTLGIIAASSRLAFFSRESSGAQVLRANPAAPFLIPLLAVIATAMVTRGLFNLFNPLYPLGVFAGTAALVFYWKKIPRTWTPAWSPIVFGICAFLLFMALRKADKGGLGDMGMRAGLGGLSGAVATAWILFRISGAVIVAPISEELAFRGYAMRKLIANEFETVSLTHFSWLSFLGSSLLFGMLHSQWFAETLIGMIFAAAVYRRGLIWDGIVAHGLTNGLLSAYVLTTGHWYLWA